MTFFEQVWQTVDKIPKEKVATYGQIASILGTRDARRIGHALHANKDRRVPYYTKILLAEGVKFIGDKVSPDSSWFSPAR